MELSTIVRMKVIPPAGLKPALFPSGALVYSEPNNSLYYAGGDNGQSKATYIELINNTTFGGTVTSIGIASDSLKITNSPITRSGNINVELAETGVLAGSYGSSGQVPVMTVDKFGRLTNVTLVPVNIGGTVKSVTITSLTLNVTGSPITTTGTISINLQESGVAAGTYGSGTNIPVITVDAFGRVTSASVTSIEGAAGNIYHDFTLVGNGSSSSPLGTNLKSQIVLDKTTGTVANASIVIGASTQYAQSSSVRNVSIGSNNLTKLNDASASIDDNIAIGSNSMATAAASDRNIALGSYTMYDVTTGANDNVAIGYSALKNTNTPLNSIVIGSNAQNDASYTTCTNNIIIGDSALAGAKNNIIIGSNAKSNTSADTGSIAIGNSSKVASFSVVIGDGASSIYDNSVCVGSNATSLINSLAIGQGSTIVSTSPATTDGGLAVGFNAKSNTTSLSFGAGADSSGGLYSMAIGSGANAAYDYSIAIGASAQSGAKYELAIGSTTAKIGAPDGSGIEFTCTGGSADALPALPAGYLRIRINNSLYKIPLYNV